MSYGTSIPALFRRAAIYVDKVLKGAKPANLSVEQPTKFELVMLHRPEIASAVLSAAERAARGLGLIARPFKLAEVSEFDPAFRTARSEGAAAIQVLPSPFSSLQRRVLIELAAKYRLSAVYEFKEYVEDGGLMSYGPSVAEMFGNSASHVDRILKGARPGDLPIKRPAAFEFVLNLKIAKALAAVGVARADEVIQ